MPQEQVTIPGFQRPSKEAYYCNIAREVSQRGTCLKRSYGAVIVKDDQIVATGYTGSPRGRKNCCDGLVYLEDDSYKTRKTPYESSRSVHAEMNAIVNAARSGSAVLGGTLYLAGLERQGEKGDIADPKPCLICTRILINAGIVEVIALKGDGSIQHYDVQKWIADDDDYLIEHGCCYGA